MNGYALLIGVDVVDHNHYGIDKDLCSSRIDTEKMNELLESLPDFEGNIHKFIDIDASWDLLLPTFYDLQFKANNDPEGAFVLLYFSGHGASLEVEHNGKKEKKQFLCFHDHLVSEDQVLRRIGAFNKNCSVFVILDSCCSGGIPINTIEQYVLKQLPTEIPLKKNQRRKKTISSSFPEIYKRFQSRYEGVLNSYRDYTFSTEADVFFLLACAENQSTYTGRNCSEPSVFTNNFVEDLRFIIQNHSKHNYFTFADYLKKNSHKTTKKSAYLNKPDNIFRSTLPLKINSNTINMTPIILSEILGRHVAFDLDNTVPSYEVLFSTTWIYSANNPNHQQWAQQLNAIDPDLMGEDTMYLSFVFVNKKTPRNTPILINDLFCVDPTRTDAGFGVVIVVDTNMEIINSIKPKRTTGKVSNKQGE